MKIKLMIVFIFFINILLNAQEKLNELKAPTSPASYIVGIQPSSVLAPKTAQALESALYSNFINSNGGLTIPNDFSLEFTPYWASNHGLTLKNYLFPNDFINDQIIRNSSFSIASTQKYLLEDSTSTNSLAFGYRTTLFYGNSKDREKIDNFENMLKKQASITANIASEAQVVANRETIKNTDDFLKAISKEVQTTISKVSKEMGLNDEEAQGLIKTIFERTKILPSYEENKDAFLNAFNNLIDEVVDSKTIFEKFKNYLKQRQGLSIDIAFAALLNFPTNNFDFSISPRQSIWITPTYQFNKDFRFLKLMGVLRFEWYNTDYYKKYFPSSKFYQNNTDYGISVLLEFEKFSLQFELVGRSNNSEIDAGTDSNGRKLYTKDQSSDIQYIGTFCYHLSDDIALNYSVGNRFKPEVNPNNTIVSLLSLNFGFGAPTEKDLKSEPKEN